MILMTILEGFLWGLCLGFIIGISLVVVSLHGGIISYVSSRRQRDQREGIIHLSVSYG
jgi:hypothetical protein